MPTTLQFRRYDTANIANTTGAVGELIIDTDKDTVVVQDGSTAGGFPLARESVVSAVQTVANDAYDQANSAYAQANTGTSIAQSAYGQANSAYNQANAAYGQANTGTSIAQSAYAQANAAYDAANNAQVTVFANNTSNVTTQSINFVNTSTVTVSVTPDGANANIAFTAAPQTVVNDTYTASGNTAAAATANIANGLFGISTNAYAQANAAYAQANTGTTVAQNAYDQANTAYGQANLAYAQANSAYAEANLKLNISGGTINGSLNVSGDLSITGNTHYINVDTYIVSDPLIYLAANNETSDLVDIGFIGGHNTAGVYQHSGLARDAGDGTWYLFTGLADEGHENNVVDFANTTLATLRANINANSILLAGNPIATQANLTLAYNQANTGTTIAQSAYGQANLAYSQANAGTTIAQNAYGQANAAYAQANTGTTIAQNAYGQANTARNQANTAYGQANLAYAQANSGTTIAQNAYEQANTARTQANTARDQANAAYGQANTAYGQANSAYNQANSAYTAANNRVLKTGDTMTGNLNVAANLIVSNGDVILDDGVAGFETIIQSVPATANQVISFPDKTGIVALTSDIPIVRISSNTGSTVVANGINFNNTATVNVSVSAGTTGNANVSFTVNTTGSGITTAQTTAQNAFDQANTARTQANTAYGQANSAFAAANNRVLKTGDTITGTLNVVNGNLIVSNGQVNTTSFVCNVAQNSVFQVQSSTLNLDFDTLTFDGSFSVNGNITLASANTININAPVAIANTLRVSGAAVFGNTITANAGQPIITVSANTYTLGLGDVGDIIQFSNANTNILTVPNNATVPIQVGGQFTIVQLTGNGTVQIANGIGVTVNSRSGVANTAGQWAVAFLYKRDTDSWVLTGDIA